MPLDDANYPTPPNQDPAGPGQDAARPRSGWAMGTGARDWRADREAHRAQEATARETADAVADLKRLRAIGMNHAERTEREAEARIGAVRRDPTAKIPNPAITFLRVARAVRQIIVLQQELLGQRPVPVARAMANKSAPDTAAKPQAARPPAREPNDNPDSDLSERSDINDLDDYDDRAFQQVLAGVCAALDLATPLAEAEPAPAKSPALVTAPKAWARSYLTASTALATPIHERGPP